MNLLEPHYNISARSWRFSALSSDVSPLRKASKEGNREYLFYIGRCNVSARGNEHKLVITCQLICFVLCNFNLLWNLDIQIYIITYIQQPYYNSLSHVCMQRNLYGEITDVHLNNAYICLQVIKNRFVQKNDKHVKTSIRERETRELT